MDSGSTKVLRTLIAEPIRAAVRGQRLARRAVDVAGSDKIAEVDTSKTFDFGIPSTIASHLAYQDLRVAHWANRKSIRCVHCTPICSEQVTRTKEHEH